MRFHRPLHDILGNRTALRVLRAMTLLPHQEWSGRELARESGAAASNVIRELRALRDQGLVERRTVGNVHLWRVRKEHYLFEPLDKLLSADALAFPVLQDTIQRHLERHVARAVVFGSIARGTERPDSDLDLFVVLRSPASRRTVERRLMTLRAEILDKFGNVLRPVVYAPAELRSKRVATLLAAVARDGVQVVP